MMKAPLSYCTLGVLLAGTVLAAKSPSDKEFYFDGVPEIKDVPKAMRVLPTGVSVKKLSLFKNGFGFFSLTTSVPEDYSKTIAITPRGIPNAIHGTFWIKEDSKKHVSHISSSKSFRDISVKEFSSLDLALCNPGTKVRVKTASNGLIIGAVAQLQLSGENISAQNMMTEVPKQEASQKKGLSIEIPPNRPEKLPFLCIQEDGEGLHMIPGHEIQNIVFLEPDRLKTPTIKEQVPVVTFYLKDTGKDTPINFSCVSRGITWVPSYQIDLSHPDKAGFQAKTTIINELMDIDNAELELITGYPSLPFMHVPSPVGLRQTMDLFFQMISGQSLDISGTRNVLSNQIMSKMAEVSMDESISYPSASGAGLENFQSEDLFFYPIKRLTCAKNETVTFPLFSGKTPYTHLYTWEIPADAAAPTNRGYNPQAVDEVWHCIKLTNSFPMPLTSAPVEFVSQGRIVGQNTLEFTPTGQKAKIKLNKALEFSTDKVEKVLSQTPKKDDLGRHYVEIQIEGKLKISNLADKSVTMEISKHIMGQSLKADGSSDIILGKSYGNNYNLNGIIKWNFEMAPKETKTLPYTYTFIQR